MRIGVDGTQGLNFDSGETLYLGSRAVISGPNSAFWFGGGYAGMAGSGDNRLGFQVGLRWETLAGINPLLVGAGLSFGL